MRRVQERDLKRLSEALAELYTPAGIERFPERMLAAMGKLISADQRGYNEFGPGHFAVVCDPYGFTPEQTAAFTAHMHEHPSLQHVWKTGTTEAVMFSDFLSLREFRETGIYREFFGPLGINRQVGGLFDLGGGLQIGYSFNRWGRAYSEEERLLANLLARHLPLAWRNAELWSKQAASTERVQLIGIDRRGRILHSTEESHHILRAYFPKAHHGQLPDALTRWAKARRTAWSDRGEAPVPAASLRIDAPRGSLEVHYSPTKSTGLQFLLLKEIPAATPELLRSLGLTTREAEVLFWVSQGKRNQEIAIVLGISPATVGKHLEHIYPKLGVETRAAAGAVAREVLA